MRREWTCVASLAIQCVFIIGSAQGVVDEDEKDQAQLPRYRQDRFLVIPAKGMTEAATQEAVTLRRTTGTDIARTYQRLKGLQEIKLVAEADIDAVMAQYKASGLYAIVQPDYLYRIADNVPNDPLFSQLWGMNNSGQTGGTPGADISALQAWDKRTDASSVIVAVIDTGVMYTHPDLRDNIWVNTAEDLNGNGIFDTGDVDGLDQDGNGYADDVVGYNFCDYGGSVPGPDPIDGHGHGTHCAGTIGAVGHNGDGVAGVCWNTQIMCLRFLDSSGIGNTSDAIGAIYYAVENGATVLSNSWGGPGSDAALDVAIQYALDHDVVFVAAAGNEAVNIDYIISYPGASPKENVVSVAASDHNDNIANFSNYGPTNVDLAAPGVNVYSTWANGGYRTLSGTSMATPHVAGACTLLRAQYPDLNYAQIITLLFDGVDPLPQWAGLVATGGRLNIDTSLGTPTTGRIGGVVHDLAGNPLADAVVTTSPGGYTDTTTANGEYLISGIDPGTYSVIATKGGYSTETQSGVVVVAGERNFIDFTLSKIAMQGVLINGDLEDGFHSTPLGNVADAWQPVLRDPGDQVTFDEAIVTQNTHASQEIIIAQQEQGGGIVQQVSGLPAGASFVFRAQANIDLAGYDAYLGADPDGGLAIPAQGTEFPGAAHEWHSQEVAGVVGPGGTISVFLWAERPTGIGAASVYFDNATLDVEVVGPMGTLAGFVKDALDNPVAGALVTTEPWGYVMATEPDGSFTLPDVLADTYSVTARKRDYQVSTQTGVVVQAAQTTQVTFQLDLIPGVEVLVNGDFEGGFSTHWGGEMPNGWSETFRPPWLDGPVWDDLHVGGTHGHVMRMHKIDDSGEIGIRQTVTGLTPGEQYTLSGEAYQLSAGTTVWMAVDPTGGTSLPARTVSFENTPGRWNYQDLTGTVGAGGAVTVFLWGYNEGGMNDVYFDAFSLKVGVGGPVGAISGFVRDDQGNPIAGAAVSATPGSYATASNPDGSYLLSGLGADTYAVTASQFGYQAQTIENVAVLADQTTSVDFSLSLTPGTEVLVNGDFESGFFSHWGGTIPNAWSDSWRDPWSDGPVWGDANLGGDHGHALRMSSLNVNQEVGIRQTVSGLTPGEEFIFSAESYQDSSGTSAWLAANADGGTTMPLHETRFPEVTGQWVYQEVRGTVGTSGSVTVFLWAWNQSVGSDVSFDNASLLVGVVPPVPPVIVAAESVASHGTAGLFPIDVLHPAGTAGAPVENRWDSPTQLVVTFDMAVAGDGGLDPSDVSTSSGTVTGVTANQDTLTISMEDVAPDVALQIGFPGIQSAQGIATNDSLCISVLYADVDGSQTIDIFDLLGVRNHLSMPVTADTARFDSNLDGELTIFDMLDVRNRLGANVPACP